MTDHVNLNREQADNLYSSNIGQRLDTGDIQAIAFEIRVLFAIVTKLAKRELEVSMAQHGVGVSALQYGIMRLLHHKQHTLTELSNTLLLKPATLVPVIDALERHGYALRKHDPLDRRRVPLTLTEKGVEMITTVPYVNEEDSLMGSLKAMGGEKSAQLLELVRELVLGLPEGEEIVLGVHASAQVRNDMILEET
ncbi:MAG: MarR family transcriptional regulator [Chloroflexota bacterium]